MVVAVLVRGSVSWMRMRLRRMTTIHHQQHIRLGRHGSQACEPRHADGMTAGTPRSTPATTSRCHEQCEHPTLHPSHCVTPSLLSRLSLRE